MKNKCFLRLIILFLFMLLSLPVFAAVNIAEKEARDWADNKGGEILRILSDKNLQRKYAALDEIMNRDIDLDNAARFAAGKYWRQMTEEQKNSYLGLFKRYLNSVYKSYPLDFNDGDIGFKTGKILPIKNGVEVHCSISISALKEMNGKKYPDGFPVIFLLVKNSGRIQVSDLKIGESSLLMALRGRFYKMIYEDNDEEISWFLEDLSTLTEDAELANLQKLEKNGTF